MWSHHAQEGILIIHITSITGYRWTCLHMGHNFRTAKVLRTCSILKAKFLTTWTTVHAGKLFLKLPERMEFVRCQVFHLPLYSYTLPDATECFQLQIHTTRGELQRTILDGAETFCSFFKFSIKIHSENRAQPTKIELGFDEET